MTREALWNAIEVAKYLSVSRSWVYQRSNSGELPCIRFMGHVRFDPVEIRNFIEKGRSGDR